MEEAFARIVGWGMREMCRVKQGLPKSKVSDQAVISKGLVKGTGESKQSMELMEMCNV